MDTLLIIIEPPVGNDFRIQDMYFANRPSVEARLGKQLFDQIVIANLHVADAKADAFDEGSAGDRARVDVLRSSSTSFPTTIGMLLGAQSDGLALPLDCNGL